MTNWNEILISCLPLIIIIVIWILIMKRFKRTQNMNKAVYDHKHSELIGVMKEIRDELKELNKNNAQKL